MAVPASAGPGGRTCRRPAARAGSPSSTGRLSSIPVAARFPDCAVRAAPRPRLCPCAGCAGTATAAAEADSGVLPGARPVRRSGHRGEPDRAAPPHPHRRPHPALGNPRPHCHAGPHRGAARIRESVAQSPRAVGAHLPHSRPGPSSQRQARAGRVPGGREGGGLPRRRARQPHRSPQPCSISVPITTP